MEDTSIPRTSEHNVTPLPELNANGPKREVEVISQEKEAFKLLILKSKDTIIFSASKINDITVTKYKNELTLKNFYDSNKYFKQFDTTEELFTQFITNISDKEIEVSCKEKAVTIKLIYENVKKKNEFVINLKAQESKVENIVENLCIQFTNLQNKMDQQEKINEDLKKQMNEQKKVNDDQMEIIEELKKQMDEQMKINEELKKQMDEQMKINEELKKVNDEQEKEIKELKEMKKKLQETNKEQIKILNDTINQKIEGLKSENQRQKEESQMKLQKQKEEYEKEIDQLKKQKDELIQRQNKAEKDINLIFNQSAPYQIQDFKQFSEIKNTIYEIQTKIQNQNQNKTIKKKIHPND